MPDRALFNANVPLPSFPLIDCHVHLGASDAESPSALYYPTLTGEEYLRMMKAAGVETACAFPSQRSDGYYASNHAIRRWAQRRQQRDGGNGSGDGSEPRARVRPFARLGGRHLPLRQAHLWRLRRKASFLVRGRPRDLASPEDLRGFAGVKLLPHMDGLPSEALFARIRALRLPVLIHGGQYSEPSWIEKAVLPKLDGGPLIVAHLGAFPADAGLLREGVALAKRHANVYLDTSGAWLAGFVRHAAREVPGRLVFGSDAPLAHPLVAWQHVASALPPGDEALRRRIGREAALEIFDW